MAKTSPHERRRLLLIDDDPMILRAIGRSMKEAWSVIALEDASEGLARVLLGERFDVILCDVRMPGMDGLRFFHALPETVRPRLVFITGDALDHRTLARLRETGAPVLRKPFPLSALLQSIQEQLTVPLALPESVSEPESE
ncbi:MAG: response regulator [Myxococcota bacterium]